MVARDRIELPTRGFSVRDRWFWGLMNQSLTALANLIPRPTPAQLRHTKSELVTFLAHHDTTSDRHKTSACRSELHVDCTAERLIMGLSLHGMGS